MFDEREAKTCASAHARSAFVDTIKALEYALKIFFINTNTAVRNIYPHTVCLFVTRDAYAYATAIGIGNRIVDEVVENNDDVSFVKRNKNFLWAQIAKLGAQFKTFSACALGACGEGGFCRLGR